jgi:uncharacterized protein (DUF427 family)
VTGRESRLTAVEPTDEADERILGHAADPGHRIDIRRSSRHLVVRQDDQLVAETHAPPATSAAARA